MQRIEAAIADKRCVFVLGSGIVGTQTEEELIAKGLYAVSLTSETSKHVRSFSAENLAPSTQNQGIIVLVEPNFDEEHVEAFSTFIASQNPRPQIFIAAKFFNRFSMPMSMMSLKMTHFKHNALNFFRSIPKIEIKRKSEKSVSVQDIAFEFIGRNEEVASVTEMLSSKGYPVCLHGIEGMGKRYLAEEVIGKQEWIRIPDLHINHLLQADALLGRLAQVFADVGDNALLKGLSARNRISVQKTLELLRKGLENEAVSNYVFIISGIQSLLNNRSKFKSVGLLEMVLEEIWKTETSMKLIFLTSQLPDIGSPIRALTLRAFTADEVKASIAMWQAPEATEEELNAILNRTQGHPIALRFLLLRSKAEGSYSHLSDEKFAFMSDAGDFRQVRKMMQKLTNKIAKEDLDALKKIAIFNAPVHAKLLTDMGINRKLRAKLIESGVLEQTPSAGTRRYYAHELIHSTFKTEEIFDYDTVEEIAEIQMERSKEFAPKFNKSNPSALQETALIQEANALFWAARKRKRMWKTNVPCVDAIVVSATELSSRKAGGKVDFGHIADLQIKDGLQMAPDHPELLFLEARRSLSNKEKRKNSKKIFEERRTKALMPKFILEEVNLLLELNQSTAASQCLQEGLRHFPHIEDMWFKQATLLSDQGQAQAALQTIDKALALHPTSATYHSFRGKLLADSGTTNWKEASAAIAQATALYAGNAPLAHTLREIDMLKVRAMVDVDSQTELLTEAKEKLEVALKTDEANPRLQVALAGILLDLQSEDYATIESLLKVALKKRDNSDAHLFKARLLIRQDNLIDVENHLDRAFKISRNNSAVNTVRGEFYLITGKPVFALKAFQSALDASTPDTPEFEQAKRHVEQITAILAAQSNVNYAEIGEEGVNVMPLHEDTVEAGPSSKPAPKQEEAPRSRASMLRKRHRSE